MTQIILKTELDSNKLEALLHFLKSWGIEAEINSSASPDKTGETLPQADEQEDLFAETRGLWADYDIDIKKIRQQEWIRRTRSHISPQFSFGMWEDYDIDDKTLREKAFGTTK